MDMVSCHQCDRSYDPSATTWCECIGIDQTLVCPHCGRCFCEASNTFKREFWSRAPAALTRSRLDHLKKLSAALRDPDSLMLIERPLVLVCDDEPAVLRLAARLIRKEGHGVLTASDGVQGLDRTLAVRQDLVLVDALMPRLDGREMCRQIKKRLSREAPPVVVMTGVYKAPSYGKEAVDSFQADDFLAKPIQPAVLRDLFQKYLT